MAWSDAARAAAVAARKAHAHSAVVTARGRASGPGASLHSALRDQANKAKIHAVKAHAQSHNAKAFGGIGRHLDAIKASSIAAAHAHHLAKVAHRYGRLVK